MSHQELLDVLRETRTWLTRPNNDFVWSSWNSQDEAVRELDSYVAEIARGARPDLEILFAPTGSIQEVSLSSGWGEEFIDLASRFDRAWAAYCAEQAKQE